MKLFECFNVYENIIEIQKVCLNFWIFEIVSGPIPVLIQIEEEQKISQTVLRVV